MSLTQNDPTHLLWCDLETTGLEPFKGDKPLEFAFRLTSFKAMLQGSEDYGQSLWNYQKVIHFGRSEAAALKFSNKFTHDMHTQNNLLEECAASDVTCEQVEIEVMSFLQNDIAKFGVTNSKQILLAGSSVHFDRKWLEWFTPGISEALNYRIMDVSSLYPLLRIIGIKREPRHKEHRAMKDIERSIGELSDMINLIKG